MHIVGTGGTVAMTNKVIFKQVLVVVLGTAMFTDTGLAYPFDMCKNIFDMMNRSKLKQSEWEGNYGDRDGYDGNSGVASGYGYGSPAYGYGAPPVPGYGYTVPAYSAPQPGNEALQMEIYQLQLRIKNLEEALNHASAHQ
jgi:hypothetical protein